MTNTDTIAAAAAIITVIPETIKPTKREILLLSKRTLSEWETVIDDVIPSERDRKLVKRWLIDDIKQEALAEEMQLSPRFLREILDESYHKLIRACGRYN